MKVYVILFKVQQTAKIKINKTLQDKQKPIGKITVRATKSTAHSIGLCRERGSTSFLLTSVTSNSGGLVQPEKYLSSWGRQQPHEESRVQALQPKAGQRPCSASLLLDSTHHPILQHEKFSQVTCYFTC